MNTLSKEWAISMAFSITLLLIFGLGLVWLNIERVDLAYELNKIQRQIDDVETLTAKLEVERNTLITPARLREVSREYNLGPARSGQIRRVNVSGEVESSSLVTVSVIDESRKGGAKTPVEGGTSTKVKTSADGASPTKAKSKAGQKP
jgi:cell division protein FtsL